MAKSNPDDNYTKMPNDLLNNAAISDGAKVFWVYLESKPDTWSFHDSAIVKELKVSKETLRRRRNELRKFGFIAVKEVLSENGAKNGWDYIMYNKPRNVAAIEASFKGIEFKGGVPHINMDTPYPQKCGERVPTDLWGHRKTNTNKTNNIVATEVDDEVTDEKEISETMTMAIAVGDHLVQKLSESIETYKPPTPAKMKGWYRDIERAIRLDGRTQEQLISVIDWIHDGSGTFWIANIKSGKKLRDQFDTLWFQMHESAPKVNVRQRALADFGLGNVFYKYKDVANNRIVSVCIYGDYGSLYDYNGNKYISKDVADKLWKHIEKEYDQILAAFKGDYSAKLSA